MSCASMTPHLVPPRWLEIPAWKRLVWCKETLVPCESEESATYSSMSWPARRQQLAANRKPGVAVTGSRLLMHVSSQHYTLRALSA